MILITIYNNLRTKKQKSLRTFLNSLSLKKKKQNKNTHTHTHTQHFEIKYCILTFKKTTMDGWMDGCVDGRNGMNE